MWNLETSNLAIEALAALFALAPAQDPEARTVLNEDLAIVQDGGRIARVSVADDGARRTWAVARLRDQLGDLAEEPPHAIAPALLFVPTASRIDALRRVGGGFALARDVHRGGTQMLELVEIDGSLVDAPALAPEAGELPASVRSIRFLTEADVAATGGAETFIDLFAPRLLEHEGRLHVIASSNPVSEIGEPRTWIAEPPASGRKLDAREIGLGADARVARLGNLWCCLVRALTPSDSLDDDAPVHVYLSGDLRSWAPALPVDEESPLFDYDVISDLGSLWLAGVAANADAEGAVVRLWRLDTPDGRWNEIALDVELPATAARVRLLSSTVGVAVPKLVIPQEDGRARVIPLPAE